jgi:hypothetical protein
MLNNIHINILDVGILLFHQGQYAARDQTDGNEDDKRG